MVEMVDTGGSSWHATNRGVSIFIGFYLLLLVIVAYLSKLLHEFPKLGSLLPEAAMITLVGMIAGFFLHLATGDYSSDNDLLVDDVAQSVVSFSPTVFFVILLPPIIFNSGYHLQRDLFFRYIKPICLYACLGTIICTVVVATLLLIFRPLFGTFQPSFLELLAFGALISATDPVSTLAVFSSRKVDPPLFQYVSGESLINDAVGLVLFESLAHLLELENSGGSNMNLGQEFLQFLFDFVTGFVGSLCLGTIFGLVYAFCFKHIDLRATPFYELCIYITMMYTPFVVAEILHLSGIVTVLFSGIAAKRYAFPNVSRQTADNADFVFRLASHWTETVIFLDLGLSVAGLVGTGALHPFFVVCSLVACFVGRAANIYPITAGYNWFVQRGRKHEKTDEEPSTGYKAPDDPELRLPASRRGDDTSADVVEQGEVQVKSSSSSSSSASVDAEDGTIPWNTAHMIWFSGLRGAVSYGLVRTFPLTGNQTGFAVTTMIIVLVTTFILGGGTDLMLKRLNIPMNVDEAQYLKSIGKKQLLEGWLHNFEEHSVRRWAIRDFDKKLDEGAESEGYVEAGDSDGGVPAATTSSNQIVVRATGDRKAGPSSTLYDFGQ